MKGGGIMKRKQSGQSIVEFALILPFFLLLLAGITAFGMMFADYISLNNAARAIAREVSVTGSTTAYQAKYKNYGTMTNMYLWDIGKVKLNAKDDKALKQQKDVEVTITSDLNRKSGLLGFFGFLSDPGGKNDGLKIIPNPITITYTMYNESYTGSKK